MVDFSNEEPDLGLEGSMENFGSAKSLISCFEEVSVSEKDFSFGLGSLHIINFFFKVTDCL